MSIHWADIYAAIYKKRTTPTEIAKKEDVSLNTVTGVIRGTKTSHKVAYAISEIINIPTEKLWPGKYVTSPAEYKKLRGNNSRGRLPGLQAPEQQMRKAS